MQSLKRLLTLSILPLGLWSGSLQALPKGVALHAKLQPSDELVNNIGTFASSVSQGTPWMMYTQASMIKMMLPNLTQLPNQLIDFSKGAHLLVQNPKPGQAPLSGVWVPIVESKDWDKGIVAKGFKKSKDGLYRKEAPSSRKPATFLLKGLGPFIAMAPSEEAAQAVLEMKQSLGKTSPPSKSLELELDLQQIRSEHRQTIDMAWQGFETQMKKSPMPAVGPFIKVYKDLMMLLLDQSQSLHLSLDFSAQGLRQSFGLRTEKGSQLENALNTWSKVKGKAPKSLAAMPKDSQSASYILWSPDVINALDPIVMPILSQLQKQSPTGLDLVKTHELWKKSTGDHVSFATYAKGDSFYTLSSQDIRHGQQQQKLVRELMPKLGTWIQSLLSQIKDMPMTLHWNWNNDHQKVQGYGVDQLLCHFEVKGDTPSAEALKAQLKNSSFEQWNVVTEQQLISLQCQGGSVDAKEFESQLLAQTKGKSVLGQKASFKLGLEQVEGSQAASLFYLLDIIKTSLDQQSDSFKYLPLPIDMKALVAMLGRSQIASHASFKSSSDRGEIELTLPTEALQEIVMNAMQAFMQLQMQQMQK